MDTAGAQDVERRSHRSQSGKHGGQTSGDGAETGHLGDEPLRTRPVGELAVEQELPDVFERSSCGQVGGRVLAVVEEPFLSAYVADRGLGHYHPFEAPGHVGADLVGRPDLGHGQEIPDGHHPDQLAVVDDREMAVVVVGESRPCLDHLVVEGQDIGVGGHPPPDRFGRGGRRWWLRPAAGPVR